MPRIFFCFLTLVLASSLYAAPKVISLGFDGIDPVLAQDFMDQGKLPNLKKLADQGGFSTLETVVPSQSPVCWSSMLNGTNPGKHGVMGFVKRNEGDYTPRLGIIKVEDRVILGGALRHWTGPATIVLLFILSGALIGRFKREKSTDIKAPKRYAIALALLLSIPFATAAAWVSQQLPTEIKQPVNARTGPSYFEILAEKGHNVAALNAPMDWPVAQREKVLEYAGFNIPDLRGSFGIYSFYTDSYSAGEFVKSEMGADVYRVDFTTGAPFTTYKGPRNVMKPEEGFPPVEFQLRLEKNEESLGLVITNNVHDFQSRTLVKLGEWTDWIFLEAELSPLVKIKGKMRFFLESLTPELRLYATPLQFDPQAPAGGNQIANPPEYFPEIEELVDGMDSLGWPELTHPLYDGNIRDQAFMDHLLDLEGKRAKALYKVLEDDQHECVSAWFYGPDRVQHMMYRYIDEDYFDYKALQASPLRDSILKSYQQMDQIVGEVLTKYCDDETLLLIMSDHGFAPFNRAVSLSRWLVQEGYLVLKGEQKKRHASDMFSSEREALLAEIDWSKTKAYALGLGKIFLNVKGREPQGIVEEGEVKSLAEEIRGKLMQIRDDANNDHREIMNHVYLRDEIADGPFEHLMADLVVGFKRGYRVSWQTTLGRAEESVIFENNKRWSGDHCSIDPALIPGSLFANHKLPSRCNIKDLHPTILAAFDIAASKEVDGEAIPLSPFTTKED